MSDIEDEEVPAEKVKIENKRIFINHVDTFNGKNLAKVCCNFFFFVGKT
jgi:hypothetical protein